jgi:hypothetical protein
MRRYRIVLLAVGLLLALAGLGALLLWRGELPTRTPALIINSQPPGSEVSVDGESMGTTPCKLRMTPGTYQVTLQKEHFAPWSQQISVEESQSQRLEVTLRFVTYVMQLAQELAFDPVWSQDGTLSYLTYTEGELRPRKWRSKAEGPAPAFDMPAPGAQYTYVWAPRGDAVLVCYQEPNATEQRYCQGYSFRSERWTDLTEGNPALLDAVAVAWSADARQFAYLLPTNLGTESQLEEGYDEGPLPCELWICKTDGSNANRMASWDNASHVVWSPRSRRLAVESWTLGVENNRVWLVTLNTDTVEEIPVIGASGAVWSDDGEWLAMHALGSSDLMAEGLWVCDQYGGQLRRVTSDIPSHYRWQPGTHQLVYFTHPAQGGASCWSVDIHTGDRILLADSGILQQQVGEFAISLDGRSIAFVAQNGWLYLLVLGE